MLRIWFAYRVAVNRSGGASPSARAPRGAVKVRTEEQKIVPVTAVNLFLDLLVFSSD